MPITDESLNFRDTRPQSGPGEEISLPPRSLLGAISDAKYRREKRREELAASEVARRGVPMYRLVAMGPEGAQAYLAAIDRQRAAPSNFLVEPEYRGDK